MRPVTSWLCWDEGVQEQIKKRKKKNQGSVHRFGSHESEVDSVWCAVSACRERLVPRPFMEYGINYKYMSAWGFWFFFSFSYMQHMSNPYGWPRARRDVVNTRYHMLDINWWLGCWLWWRRVIQHSSGCQILSLEIEVSFVTTYHCENTYLGGCVCQDQVTVFYIIQHSKLWPRWPPAMTGWINNPCCRNPFTSLTGMFNPGDMARS